MIKKFFALPVIFSIMCFSLITACGSDSDDKTSASSPNFYESMKDTTPVYAPVSARQSKHLVTGGTWDHTAGLLYSVFFTLREFNPETDEGVVDRSNFYKLLYDVENVFSGSYSYAPQLSFAQAIASPFAGIDTSATTFTHAANIEDDSNSIAYTETDQQIDALITWEWTEDDYPDKAERGIAYFTYLKNTQDITVDMVFWVHYPDQSDYSLRCKASGNAADHSFQFNYLISNSQILAKGVSQGEGNYVVFKFDDNDGPYYLRVDAGEGEEFFKNIFDNDNAGIASDPDAITDDLDYITWLDDQIFMTSTHLLDDTAELNINTDEEGTINLVFTE